MTQHVLLSLHFRASGPNKGKRRLHSEPHIEFLEVNLAVAVAIKKLDDLAKKRKSTICKKAPCTKFYRKCEKAFSRVELTAELSIVI